MHRFIQKFLTIASIPILIVLIIFIINTSTISSSSYWRIDNNINNLIMGNSHPECAVNDTMLNSYLNVASSGESYFYTFVKAKKIIKSNPSVNTIYLQIGNTDLQKSIEKWIFGSTSVQSRFFEYHPLFEKEDYKFYIHYNFKAVLEIPFSRFIKDAGYTLYTSVLKGENFRTTLLRGKTRYGGYRHLDRNMADDLQNKKKLEKKDRNKNIELSQINLFYLNELINYCHDHNVKVYLIRCPIHHSIQNKIHNTFIQKVKENNFPDVEYLDFSTFKLADSCFADFGHLNYHGAYQFTTWIRELFADDFLSSINKQEQIDIKITTRSK